MTRERQRAPMMSSVVEYSRLRSSLAGSLRVRFSVRYVRSVENEHRSLLPPYLRFSPSLPVSSTLPPPPRSTKDLQTIARGRAERYNVPRTRSVSASTVPVHAAGTYRLCRWSLVWTSSAIPPRENAPSSSSFPLTFFSPPARSLVRRLLFFFCVSLFLLFHPSSFHRLFSSLSLSLSLSVSPPLLLFRGRGCSCLRLSAAGDRRCFSFTRGYPDARTRVRLSFHVIPLALFAPFFLLTWRFSRPLERSEPPPIAPRRSYLRRRLAFLRTPSFAPASSPPLITGVTEGSLPMIRSFRNRTLLDSDLLFISLKHLFSPL